MCFPVRVRNRVPKKAPIRHQESVENFTHQHFLPFREQNYEQLLKELRSQNPKQLFIDPYFPTDLYDKDFKWIRLTEFDPDSVLFINRPKPPVPEDFRLRPGKFNAVWLHTALSQVAQRPLLFNWLLPDVCKQMEQRFGIYRVRFWHAGVLREVVIDDFLPFKSDSPDSASPQPVFVQSSFNKHEYWCSLIEKAYVKLHGSYAFLESGHSEQAFADLTAGFPQTVRLNLATLLNPFILFREMQWWIKNKAMINSSIKYRDYAGELLDTGLITGYAYSVTNAKVENGIRMLELRSPDSGRKFCNSMPAPKHCCRGGKSKLENSSNLFWMRYDEFVQNFHYVIVVHLVQQLRKFPVVFRYMEMPWFVNMPGKLIRSWVSVTHLIGVFTLPCAGWQDWSGLVAQRQFGFDVSRSDNKLLLHLVQESLPLKPVQSGSLNLLILQAENGRKHRVHNFEANKSLKPTTDVEISQYGGCFSTVLGRGTYILVPYCKVEPSGVEFTPRRFSLRVAVTSRQPVHELVDSVRKPWSTITKLSVTDFAFQIPGKREQLHEKEFLQ